MVMMTGTLAVRGTVVWLTPQQGGRVSGPPEPDYDYDYTATAYLPPRTPEDGQAGIALRHFSPGAWRTPADAILVPAKGNRAQQVIPGCIVIITEGVRPVGLLTVEEVNALAPDGTPVVTTAPSFEATVEATPLSTEPPYRHSTAAARWTSKHASDDSPTQPAGV
ncbi:hypothetical protein EV649_0718 [Kribbella sp. VKM Ac-2569]|uniref:hypothetical protein n=1 Tax=Kribbella sp. VKM Ac-2569 TaxID=2512220 RepID=UPI00102C5450|nr:hypothetical protein [Kribbella sp. VKM Ac-2569]RZT26970.1 hypothetical protein EV649_0718 [Kribbella sp. VKM Ac-2569]